MRYFIIALIRRLKEAGKSALVVIAKHESEIPEPQLLGEFSDIDELEELVDSSMFVAIVGNKVYLLGDIKAEGPESLSDIQRLALGYSQEYPEAPAIAIDGGQISIARWGGLYNPIGGLKGLLLEILADRDLEQVSVFDVSWDDPHGSVTLAFDGEGVVLPKNVVEYLRDKLKATIEPNLWGLKVVLPLRAEVVGPNGDREHPISIGQLWIEQTGVGFTVVRPVVDRLIDRRITDSLL